MNKKSGHKSRKFWTLIWLFFCLLEFVQKRLENVAFQKLFPIHKKVYFSSVEQQ